MSFSFGKILGGFAAGMTIPFVVHDNIYYAIATCFLAPHVKAHKIRSDRHKDLAIPVETLDYYIKDIGKSFIFFFMILGPTLYKTYVMKQDIFDTMPGEDQDMQA